MIESPEPEENRKPDPEPPEKVADGDDDAGEFISRQVLEKDTVFFEG